MVAGERLVGALAVEHHLQPGLFGRPHHEPLRDDRRGAERLVLGADDRRQHVDELARVERDPVRLRARLRDDRLRERPLVEPALLEERRERALAVADGPRVLGLRAQEVVDGADDRGRVDPAGEAGADGDVAAQSEAHRVEEELPHSVGGVAVHVARLELPVTAEPKAALVDDERVRGWELSDPREERVVRVVDVALLEEVADRRQVRLERARGAEGLQLAREREPPAVPRVVERLHAEAVARAEEPLPRAVPQRERPHPVEPAHAVVAPLLVRADDHLGVGLRAEPMAAALQLAAQLAVVVDLAVVHQLQRSVVARERLPACVAQVDDREPPEAERDAVVGERAVAVRAPVVERRGHPTHGLRLGRTPEIDDTAEPAHLGRDALGAGQGLRLGLEA